MPPERRAIPSSSDRFRRGLLALTVLISTAYFYQGSGWNQNSRFDLVRALIERGTVRIDAYHHNTGDKAYRRGHFYSDKAPGTSLTALPAVLAARWVLAGLGIDPQAGPALTVQLYVATLVTGCLANALSALLVLGLVCHFGGSFGGGAFAALLLSLGGPMWTYGTLFIGHALTAACLVAAFASICGWSTASRPGDVRLAGTAFLLAWACVVEYPAVPPALALFLFAGARVWFVWPQGERARAAAFLFAGAAVPAVVLGCYNWAAFGHPLRLSYSFVNPLFSGMQSGVMGVTRPRLDVLLSILAGPYRGILLYSPALLASPFGIWRLLARGNGPRRAEAWLLAAVPAYYLLLNAAYVYWEGGWCYGPRHIAPALPFLSAGAGIAWSHAAYRAQAVLGILCALGLALAFIVVATNAQPPSEVASPVREHSWPAFKAGALSQNYHSLLDDLSVTPRPTDPVAWNLGELVGLEGHASLLPLFGWWVAAGCAWGLAARLGESRATHSESAE